MNITDISHTYHLCDILISCEIVQVYIYYLLLVAIEVISPKYPTAVGVDHGQESCASYTKPPLEDSA
jgi:hypothetical protein